MADNSREGSVRDEGWIVLLSLLPYGQLCIQYRRRYWETSLPTVSCRLRGEPPEVDLPWLPEALVEPVEELPEVFLLLPFDLWNKLRNRLLRLSSSAMREMAVQSREVVLAQQQGSGPMDHQTA